MSKQILAVKAWGLRRNAGGKVHIRASLHVHTAFDEQNWQLITLMCSYGQLPPSFCTQLWVDGRFSDIKVDVDANPEITTNMRNYCFSVRMDISTTNWLIQKTSVTGLIPVSEHSEDGQ